MKPQLAEDAILEQVRFPCVVQPKIDGVRALNISGMLTGRSLKPFAGFGVTEMWSLPEFQHLDGEMTLGDKPNCTDRLCNRTTGAMGRFKDVSEAPDLHWWVFDHLAHVDKRYIDRYWLLKEKVEQIGCARLHLVPMYQAYTRPELDQMIASFFDLGYEGTIIRNPDAPYKPGRSSQKGQELLRVKPWADAEILVTGITEGQANGNEAKTNELGLTERSSAKPGMVPNGQVGSIQGVLTSDFKDPFTGRIVFRKGIEVTVGSGEMTVAEATYYFNHPEEIVGHIVKFKHMTHGVKDKPRFPTYTSHRLLQDIS